MSESVWAPEGWRIVHADARRFVYTLERARRFFKGRYRVLTGYELACLERDARILAALTRGVEERR